MYFPINHCSITGSVVLGAFAGINIAVFLWKLNTENDHRDSIVVFPPYQWVLVGGIYGGIIGFIYHE